MSTFIKERVTCSICGSTVEVIIIGSTNSFGSSDLDFRPPNMARSTMRHWIQQCPNCLYVARDISAKPLVDASFLKREEYITCENLNFRSGLASSFFRQHLIFESIHSPYESLLSLHRCIWACDDADDKRNARKCRKEAVVLIDTFLLKDNKKENNLLLIKADLMRRAHLFSALIKQFSDLNIEDANSAKVIAFQIRKAQEKDDSCYTFAHALKDV